MIEFVLLVAVLAGVSALIGLPLRRGVPADSGATADVLALEAAKSAKYQEIRDAELDFRTGKLSRADYLRLDRALRAEAIDVLRRLDEAQGAGVAS
jgi:hypothetical protein